MNALVSIAALVAAALVVSPAWAINKCTGPDGKVVFQDAPCKGKGEVLTVRPASGSQSSVSPSAANAIAQNRLYVGMTAGEVRRSWGAPSKINSTVNGQGTSQQWVYDRGRLKAILFN